MIFELFDLASNRFDFNMDLRRDIKTQDVTDIFWVMGFDESPLFSTTQTDWTMTWLQISHMPTFVTTIFYVLVNLDILDPVMHIGIRQSQICITLFHRKHKI